MTDVGRSKRRVRQGRKFKIAVRGIRKKPDKHLVVQAVLALSKQLNREQQFFDWLMAQDERVAAGTFMFVRHSVIMVDSLVFALFDAGRLVCCLPPDHLETALKLPGAKLWAPDDGSKIFERWVRLPEKADLSTWEHYGMAAMRYAIEWIESADKQSNKDK